ncbi:hypothetical protein [Amycolatopsis sp. WQ 127309]|uniref:hypothetical protein n=1 Tax=Amycolatopsis sp. WQ 127309 TaxID=2932773 RepID=UPI001FF5894E|nr:hypothetical protein [Amycolatopsis sp. WQ 127309]UOZ08760.1 hypothetical protein MUY22_10995 [Amycolatopsis sp. WQ 127309]
MSRQLADLSAGLHALQVLQRSYDDDMWDIEQPEFEKIRHIHLHLSVSLGKLAKAIEPLDHRFHRGEAVDVPTMKEDLSPILADLLMHVSQIANMLDGELNSMLLNRYKKNALKFSPESAFSKLD